LDGGITGELAAVDDDGFLDWLVGLGLEVLDLSNY